jgi:hypothetical protein
MLTGASKEDARKLSFANVVIQRLLRKHPELAESMFEAQLHHFAAMELRLLAEVCREMERPDLANDLEKIADQRGRGSGLGESYTKM